MKSRIAKILYYWDVLGWRVQGFDKHGREIMNRVKVSSHESDEIACALKEEYPDARIIWRDNLSPGESRRYL